MVEVCAVVDACYFTWRSTKDLGLPCVQVAVEVYDGDGSICTIDGPQKRQSDSMIPSKSNESWECFPIYSWTFLVGVCSWGST